MKKIFSKLDKPLLFAMIIFSIFGLIMILSASSMESYMRYDYSPYHYFIREAVFLIVGLFAFLFVIIFNSIFNFSPYTEKELETYVSSSQLCDEDGIISKVMLFVKIQQILTLEEYAQKDYQISRDLVKIIKQKFPDVSGIKYISHFTGKSNYALWDDNKYLEFSSDLPKYFTEFLAKCENL